MVMDMTQVLGCGPCTVTLPKTEHNPIMSDHRTVTMDASRFTLGWGERDELQPLFLGTVLFLTEQYTNNILGTLGLDYPFVPKL